MKLLDSLPPALDEAQEKALVTRIRKDDEDALNDLTLANMREGFLYAKGVCRGMIEDGELFTLTYTALKASGKRFKPRYGRFFAFSKPRIRGAVTRFWHSQDVVKHSSLHESDEYTMPVAHTEFLHDEDSDPVDAFTYFDAGHEPDTGMIEFHDALERVMPIIEEKLDAQEQMVLDLVFIAGFTFEEVGELLDISRSAVQLTRTRALKKIRVELSAQSRLLR